MIPGPEDDYALDIAEPPLTVRRMDVDNLPSRGEHDKPELTLSKTGQRQPRRITVE
ncbi:MAG: hypothetical protein AB1766_02905 [Pseudomonadota bacterium]